MIKNIKNTCLVLLLVTLSSCQTIYDPPINTLPYVYPEGSPESIANLKLMESLKVRQTFGNLKTIESKFITLKVAEKIDSDQIKQEIEEINSQKINSDQENKISYWLNPIIKWNEIARELVVKYKTNPPEASRVYALLSVGQYDALVTAYQTKHIYNRKFRNSTYPSYPSETATIAQASAKILSYLYPEEELFLSNKAEENKNAGFWGREFLKSDLIAGSEIGDNISKQIITKAQKDHSDNAKRPIEKIEIWKSLTTPPDTRLLPSWGKVKTWVIAQKVEDISFDPPPEIDSQEFKDSVNQLIQITNNLSSEQEKIAKYWADGSGTYTPSGHWNIIATDLLESNRADLLKSAHTMAFLNMSLMDASIFCWHIKYKYQVLRPTQASKEIKNIIPVPNFPSYTSGHSSFSGAASTVLGNVFPQEKDNLNKMAEEAAMSRLYGGIHYDFDSKQGLKNGRYVGDLTIKIMEKFKI